MNVVERFRSLPQSTRRLLSLGMILALVVALPLFIWALINGNFNPNKKAASGEPSVCVPQNKIITVTPSTDTNGTCHDIQAAIDAVDGDGYMVKIQPGQYNVYQSIIVNSKSNIIISGLPEGGADVPLITFSQNSWGFLVQNSSGSINRLNIQGGSANGMLSIQDSNNFSVGFININSQSSHTIDIQRSNGVVIYDSMVQSSAGAIEINNSTNVGVQNSKVFHSANAISVHSSSYVSIQGNLIYGNRESGLYASNIQNMQVVQNTFFNNTYSSPLTGTIYITTDQGSGSGYEFHRNIISAGSGVGIKVTGNQAISTFSFNDVYNHNPNYQGYANQTGINGNISSDPLLNTTNDIHCPMAGSPVLYGNPANSEYMGYIGQCGSSPTPTPTPAPTGNLNSCNGSCTSNLNCQSGLVCYQGSCKNPSCVSTSNCACIVATASPAPTGTPPPTSRPFNIMLKLDGVSDGSAHLANVTVRFISKSLNNLLGYITPPLPIVYVGNGVYRLPFGIWSAELPAAGDYAIVIKGEKHLSTKFCVASGQTQHCSGSTVGQINIPSTPSTLVSLDFTGIPLEPGDLYVQDGVVDASDFNKIKALLVKPCASLTDQDKLTGDVDYNGCVNAKDAFLIRQTLETRYDEN